MSSTTQNQQLDKLFLMNLYTWRLADAKREAEQGFPFLERMNNPRIDEALTAIRKLSLPCQLDLMKALVKNSTQRYVLSELDDSLINEEKDLLHQFHLSKKRIARQFYSLDREATEDKVVFYNKKELKNKLKSQLNQVFSKKPDRIDSDSITYNLEISKWNIISNFDIQRDCYSYGHQIRISFNEKRHVLGGEYSICFPLWLGFNHETWGFISEENINVAVESISYMCTFFLSSLPDLLPEFPSTYAD